MRFLLGDAGVVVIEDPQADDGVVEIGVLDRAEAGIAGVPDHLELDAEVPPEVRRSGREFRDRFIESAHLPGNEHLIALPQGNYEVSRAIEGPVGLEGMLGAAALQGETSNPSPALTGGIEQVEDGAIIDAAFTVVENGSDDDRQDEEMRDAA